MVTQRIGRIPGVQRQVGCDNGMASGPQAFGKARPTPEVAPSTVNNHRYLGHGN